MPTKRRTLLGSAIVLLAGLAPAARAEGEHPQRRFHEAAEAMRRAADAARDQSYGAVVVLHGELAGQSPSLVMATGDPWAHAEREAIRDAQRRLGRFDLGGAVLYSSSLPCPRCRQAAAQAGVARMYFGAAMADGGVP